MKCYFYTEINCHFMGGLLGFKKNMSTFFMPMTNSFEDGLCMCYENNVTTKSTSRHRLL